MLRSQDLIIALATHLVPQAWSYPALAAFTGLAASQGHAACTRLREARLLRQDPGAAWQVSGANLTEFLCHGAAYVFPACIAELTYGVPTAHAAAFVRQAFDADHATPVVWPTADGATRGSALEPLHPCQLRCIAQSGGEPIYRALVDIDLLRIGESRERAWARDHLAALLKHAGS